MTHTHTHSANKAAWLANVNKGEELFCSQLNLDAFLNLTLLSSNKHQNESIVKVIDETSALYKQIHPSAGSLLSKDKVALYAIVSQNTSFIKCSVVLFSRLQPPYLRAGEEAGNRQPWLGTGSSRVRQRSVCKTERVWVLRRWGFFIDAAQ